MGLQRVRHDGSSLARTPARTMLLYVFCCSDASSLDRRGLLHLAPVSAWMLLVLLLLLPPAPPPSSSFSSRHSLAPGPQKVLQAHPVCFLL